MLLGCRFAVFNLIRWRRYKGKHAEDDAQDFLESFTDALKSNPDMKPFVNRAQEDLSPLRVLELFRAIQEEDMDVLWADPEQGRPENLILTHMLVPPVCIRPSVAMEGGGGSTEDDLTAMLNEIIEINNAMTLALNNGSSMRNVMDSWDFLQVQVAAFMNGELPGLPPSSRPKKPMRGMCQRLKGKQGRFRGNLLGTRCCRARVVVAVAWNWVSRCARAPHVRLCVGCRQASASTSQADL